MDGQNLNKPSVTKQWEKKQPPKMPKPKQFERLKNLSENILINLCNKTSMSFKSLGELQL